MIKSGLVGKKFLKYSLWQIFSASVRLWIISVVVGFFLIGILTALLLEGRFGKIGMYAVAAAIGTMLMAVIIIPRQDELAATVIIAIHLYIDWYLALYVVAVVVTLVLLVVFFLTRSLKHPWVEPPVLWLWGLFLALTIFPAIRGATNLYDATLYYPNIILGGFITFWLGTITARDGKSVRVFFEILVGFGVLIAVHTIIQATTGKILLGTSTHDAFLQSVASFQLAGGVDAHRVGSFFLDPNWNGTFLAMMFCASLSLSIISSSLLGKLFSLIETFLILLALLFTYSGGAGAAIVAGVVTFTLLVGRMRYRFYTLLSIAIVLILIVVLFPTQVNLLFLHATNAGELALREGAWETGLRVMLAFPLAGIGLGLNSYEQSAAPYRVAAQYIPLAHPHNSYLELGAMAGIPVLVIFLVLLASTLWLALRNWIGADAQNRSLLGGGIAAVIALSVNSWSINGWTLPPLAAMGWLLLGVAASPLLRRSRRDAMEQEKCHSEAGHFS